MMLTFGQFLSEAVNKSEIESLRKDAAMFSKNIRRIKSPRDLYIVVQAYDKWLAHMEGILMSVFSISGSQKREKPHETWEEKEVRTKWWNLHIEGTGIFFVDWPRGSDVIRPANGEKYKQFRYDGKEAEWTKYYAGFDKARNSIYTKYGKLTRDMFAAMDEWLSQKGDSLESYQKKEEFKFADVRVRFLTTDETEQRDKAKLKEYLHALKIATDRLRHFGFGTILKDLIFEADFATNDWAAGTYDHNNTIRSTMFGYSDPRVIAHEVGHHVYSRVLKPSQREGWINLIKKNQVSFTDSDMRSLRRAYDKVIAIALKDMDEWQNQIKGVWENLPRFIDDAQAKDMYVTFWKQYQHGGGDMYIPSPFKNDINAAWSKFERTAGVPFAYHVPTGHSNKNPEEAFCETFSYYIMGRGLTLFMENQFLRITGFPAK